MLVDDSQINSCGIQGRDSLIKRTTMRFARDEDGAIIGLAVFLFLIILMVGGIGIDLMQAEMNRTRLQNTLDRAILAAADLDQQLAPAEVVQDYFTKSGIENALSTVSVDEGINYRVVSADAKTSMNTSFMKMVGIDTLSSPAVGTAEERINGVEVSLVLDVSGSMNSNSRLSNLKIAGKDFIDTMVENTEDGKLSISIVPYATQVSVPDVLFDQFNAEELHEYSHCINFNASDFSSASLSTTQELVQTMHFDPWYDFDGRGYSPVKLVQSPVCEDDSSREVLVMQKDATTLKNYISNLWAGGNTSLDVGMKWGAALLDPSTQTPIDNLIADGHVPTDFSERPHFYEDRESVKVIVLMTDGQNTSQYYINDGYRKGMSNIWWNDQEKIYSVYVGLDEGDYDEDGITEEMMFYWPHENSWVDHAYGNGTYEEEEETTETVCKSYKRNGSCKRYKKIKVIEIVEVDEPGEAAEISYADLWAVTTLEWNVEEHYEPWMNDGNAWDDWYYDVRNSVNGSTKDARTRAICQAAKDAGIIVFTIGFEAPSSGVSVLQDCASSAGHYYDVDGLEIKDAFSSIASAIAQLKLTQ